MVIATLEVILQKYSDAIEVVDLSKVNNIAKLFSEKDLKISIFGGDIYPDITNWDTSKVTSMVETFYLSKDFNQDISKWNVEKLDKAHIIFGRYGTESESKVFKHSLVRWIPQIKNEEIISQLEGRLSPIKVTDLISKEAYDRLLAKDKFKVMSELKTLKEKGLIIKRSSVDRDLGV